MAKLTSEQFLSKLGNFGKWLLRWVLIVLDKFFIALGNFGKWLLKKSWDSLRRSIFKN